VLIAIIAVALTGPMPLGKVGVFGLTTNGHEPAVAAVAMDALASALVQSGAALVITSQELDAILGAEKLKDALGCDDVSCIVEIAGAAGVDRIVSGSINKIGDSLIVSVQLIRLVPPVVERRVTVTWPGAASELAELAALAGDLLVAGEAAKGSLAISTKAAGVEIAVDGVPVQGELVEVAAGVRKVALSARGHHQLERHVIVRPGKTVLLAAELQRSEKAVAPTTVLAGGAFVPRGDTYRSDRLGVAMSFGYWADFDRLALWPAAGLVFGPGDGGDATYVESGLELAALFVPWDFVIRPFIGGGVAARFLYTRERERTLTSGSVIQTTQEASPSHSAAGVAAFARAGALMLDGPARIIAAVDWQVSRLQGSERAMSFLVFGGVVF
jgi:hypothetical protein